MSLFDYKYIYYEAVSGPAFFFFYCSSSVKRASIKDKQYLVGLRALMFNNFTPFSCKGTEYYNTVKPPWIALIPYRNILRLINFLLLLFHPSRNIWFTYRSFMFHSSRKGINFWSQSRQWLFHVCEFFYHLGNVTWAWHTLWL